MTTLDVNIVAVGVEPDGSERYRLQFQADGVDPATAARMLRDFAERLDTLTAAISHAPAPVRACSGCGKPGHTIRTCSARPAAT